MLLDQLKSNLLKAQKAKQEVTVSILRFLLAQITNAKIAKGADLSDEEVMLQIQKEVKRHQESIAAFDAGGRDDLAKKEQEELVILKSYLPEQMSEEELTNLVKSVIAELGAQSIKDMGRVMGQLVPKLQGKADNASVSRIVKEELASSQ